MRFNRSFFALLLLIVSSLLLNAAVPPIINYQGKLTGSDGKPIADGTYVVTFAIYSVPTGGTALWSEPNTAVQVKGGLFNVLLGSVINLPANIFDAPDRFFGVQVGTDAEMTPRQQIASVPFAVKAAMADKATTAETATSALLAGNGVPTGGVIMWSGAANAIPQGWALCNGQNGTPDLRNRFIVGAGDEYAVGAAGGEAFHRLAVAEMPSHIHGVPMRECVTELSGFGLVQSSSFEDRVEVNGNPSNTNSGNTGGDQPHENRPPYYALCFIMKVGN